MRRFKHVLIAFVVLVLTFLIIAFVLENQRSTSLSFFGWSTAELPVSVFMALSLMLGLIVGPVLCLIARIKRSDRKN
ncbi:uncharacterized protein DUF1049 [Pseudomonas poae]|jgi:Protein of unknown function (DUF1049).|uniref:Uncharacterized protein DUF1049 n=1 Tax=Pseudomonas poae TaxID=200451 RepID=A0A7Z1K152_9PSED|nr:DUF1049 domain-containing protein [Pseudomonas sp. JV449]MDT9631445.1 DUF1049 domain-containing protein [Pseudomonas sp. JV449]PFG58828.1 uncharacterized protein DUF1049 [Pseudomonas poae]TWR73810.1 DUF1049 domain-containing protein [Pseudomonas marginalis]